MASREFQTADEDIQHKTVQPANIAADVLEAAAKKLKGMVESRNKRKTK